MLHNHYFLISIVFPFFFTNAYLNNWITHSLYLIFIAKLANLNVAVEDLYLWSWVIVLLIATFMLFYAYRGIQTTRMIMDCYGQPLLSSAHSSSSSSAVAWKRKKQREQEVTMRYDCVRPETRLPARRDVTHVHTHADDSVGWSTHTLGYVSSRTRFPWNY